MPKKYLSLLFMFMLFLFPGVAKDDGPIEPKSNATKKTKSTKYKTKYSTKDTGKLFFWEIKSKSTTIYLLGSIHLGTKDMFPMDRAIEKAYSHSSKLAVELDPEKDETIKAMRDYTAAHGMNLFGGGTLYKDFLDADELKKLKTILPKEVPNLQMANLIKPWLLSPAIQINILTKGGYRAEHGIDKYFLKKAKKENKEILELEKPEDQMKALSAGTENEQQLMFKDIVKEADTMLDSFNLIVKMWKNGDIDGLYKIGIEDALKREHMKTFMKELNDNRNVKMVEKIEGYLATTEKHFVIAGSLHMVGKNGLVELLKAKGYETKQISKTKKAKEAEAPAK